jgi:hypothetical protein
VRVKTRPEIKMALEDSNIIQYFIKGISGNKGIHKLNNFIYRCVLKNTASHILRYLWLNLNKTKTGINHFKNSISTT